MRKLRLILSIVLIISMLTGCYTKQDEAVNKIYGRIVIELSEKNIVPPSWKYVDKAYRPHPYYSLTYDYQNTYFFFIDEELYDTYKHYWLGDVDSSELRANMNQGLMSTGDRVFYAINFNILSNENSPYFYSKAKDALIIQDGVDYYLVTILANMLFYKYTNDYPFEYNGHYYYVAQSRFDRSDVAKVLNRYIVHKENGEWIIEEPDW